MNSESNFFRIIERRMSIRRYKKFAIPQKDLRKILEAARLAPSAGNNQPWRFIVVKDQERKEFLAKSADQDFVADASVVVVVLGDPEIAPYWFLFDPMIATEHMVLAATALNYGTCWIGTLADHVPENIDSVKKALRIPKNLSIICLVTIGVSDEKPSARPRKSLQDICFDEVYGAPLKLS
jgi:nitroreductase